ncbi:alcohol dehydrogenase catalytic domain-containing protein [Mesorhizobium sp. BHbsci]
MTNTMRAVMLSEPGGIDKPKDVAVPQPKTGWVRIRVKAFGVNESEVTSRKGLSNSDFTMPRVLGIECVGLVDDAPEGSRSQGRAKGGHYDGAPLTGSEQEQLKILR